MIRECDFERRMSNLSSTYRLLLTLLIIIFNAACAQQTVKSDSPKKSSFNIKSLAKSDVDGVLDIHVREARSLLRELMIKLYRRNPRELKKSKYPDIKTNVNRLFHQVHNA